MPRDVGPTPHRDLFLLWIHCPPKIGRVATKRWTFLAATLFRAGGRGTCIHNIVTYMCCIVLHCIALYTCVCCSTPILC